MPSRILSTAVAAAAATTGLVALTVGPAYAAGVTPASTFITATSTNVKFSGTLSGLNFSVSCTNSSLTFTTPSSGYGPVNTSDPVFGGTCKDSFGGTATVKTNHTNGAWTLLAIAVGPKVQATMPKAGATFSTTTLPGCVVTAAPTGPVNLTGNYDNGTGYWHLVNAPVAFSASGCGAVSPTGTVSGDFLTSPKVNIS